MVAAQYEFQNELSASPIRLYYQDEARFGRINTVQRCWCMKGLIPTVNQQLLKEYSYLFTAVCPKNGTTCSLEMPFVNTITMDIFLRTQSEQQSNERIVLCMDKASWHNTKQLSIP